MIKALIIDDERLARAELRDLLQAHPEVDIVGEAGNAAQARELIAKHKPSLIFLDVQMPEETGFDLLVSLGENAPRVIFTTAYDSHALRAFEFAAKDYLLKPISPARLATAIDRLVPDDHAAADDSPSPDDPAGASAPTFGASDRILVGDGDHLAFVVVESIRGAESIGAHTVLWLDKGTAVVKRSLSSLEARLPAALFFRANRAQLINLRHITAVEPWFSGSLMITLDNGKKIDLSRRQARLFRERQTL
ncbi:LytR/AlgR family response regulator transcription factor [Ereboglobus luteus]|uniref:LytR/AlgR family response regulator transcription factor n=1 Tax=Ereboglobus luteus TaxID=1796921 RepID=UPI001F00FA21|nr:response regulator [Ereboglobus luteus]